MSRPHKHQARDRILPARTDGIITSAIERWLIHGSLRGDPPLPTHTQNRLERSGRTEETGVRGRACRRAGARSEFRLGCGLVSTLLFLRQRLLDYYECPGDFVPEFGELGAQQRSLRVDDDVRVRSRRNSLQSHSFPQASSHAIALYGSAQRFAYREPHTRTHAVSCRVDCACQVKHCHVRGKVTSALLVHSLKIRMTQ